MAGARKKSQTKRSPPTRSTNRRLAGAKARRRGRGRGSYLAAWPLRPPQLDERQRDVLALALIALGVFLAVVLWGGGEGGRVGHALAVALGFTAGRAKILAPIALLGAGGAMLMRPVLPALRPLRTGSICLFAGIVLALASGGSGTHRWSSTYLQAHGGAVGEALFEATHRLAQQAGVDILIVFLLLVGAILLTGASLATVLRATGAGMVDSTRMLRTRMQSRSPERAQAPTGELPAEPARAAEHLLPPEPEPGKLVVRATHVEAPPLDDEPLAPIDPWAQEPDAAEQPELDDLPAADASEEKEEQEGEGAAGSGLALTPEDLTPQGRLRERITDDPDFEWRLPQASKVLSRSTAEQSRPDTAGQERTAANLVEALGHFGVQAKVIGTVAGPHITRYELRLAPGTKVGKVAQLKDDLAYALAATDIRILAPIPGKQAVGVEVPNARRRIVRLGDVYQEPPSDWSPLTVWLGKDVAGKAIGADLAKMPHLLVAGTTGAGKSGAINAMLASVLLRASPQELRLVLVDPKQVELNHYESIPHLLTPVITSPRMAANALQNLVREMEERYGTMSLARTRSLPELNKARLGQGQPPLPYILCVIDELADLMMVAPADVEDSIIRLAQKARAVGIHLVLATQSPRVDVITGMIKANVPSRIAFAVSSQTDSRVILDQNGAESLLGQGDMLFSPVGSSRLQRIQGAYIDEPQIAKLTEFWRRQGEPELREELLEEVEPSEPEEASPDEFDPDEDPLLKDAIALVVEMGTASTSMLQRRLRLGYTRAGRLIDMLERRGVISGYEGSKPRQVLVTEADLPRVLASLEERAVAADPGER
jgi:S-DNA-T family DNA segregation ATPase FtsK/SpoIIIE